DPHAPSTPATISLILHDALPIYEYNSILADQEYTLIDRNLPYDQETQSISFAANLEPDLKAARRERVIVFIILLLVPAINLSSKIGRAHVELQSRLVLVCRLLLE